jgi:hypothetical protein
MREQRNEEQGLADAKVGAGEVQMPNLDIAGLWQGALAGCSSLLSCKVENHGSKAGHRG